MRSLLRAEKCRSHEFPLHGRCNTLAEGIAATWHVALEVHTEDQVSVITLGILVDRTVILMLLSTSAIILLCLSTSTWASNWGS
jgi:hypothetical protein